MRYLALILIVGCGSGEDTSRKEDSLPRVACTTERGIHILNPAPAGYCASVQDAEDRAFLAYSTLSDFDGRFATAESRTRAWSIVLVADKEWAKTASGMTDCDSRIIYLTDVPPLQSVIGHELAHAVQGCLPTMPFDTSGAQPFFHSNWKTIYEALAKAGLRQ